MRTLELELARGLGQSLPSGPGLQVWGSCWFFVCLVFFDSEQRQKERNSLVLAGKGEGGPKAFPVGSPALLSLVTQAGFILSRFSSESCLGPQLWDQCLGSGLLG